MKQQRESVLMYESFWLALRELAADQAMRLLDAIMEYGLYSKTPVLSGVEKSIFSLVKPQIDANNTRYWNRRGGKNSAEPEEPTQAVPETQVAPTETKTTTTTTDTETTNATAEQSECDGYVPEFIPADTESDGFYAENSASENLGQPEIEQSATSGKPENYKCATSGSPSFANVQTRDNSKEKVKEKETVKETEKESVSVKETVKETEPVKESVSVKETETVKEPVSETIKETVKAKEPVSVKEPVKETVPEPDLDKCLADLVRETLCACAHSAPSRAPEAPMAPTEAPESDEDIDYGEWAPYITAQARANKASPTSGEVPARGIGTKWNMPQSDCLLSLHLRTQWKAHIAVADLLPAGAPLRAVL